MQTKHRMDAALH